MLWFKIDKTGCVYVATYSDSLQAGRSGDRIAVGGEIFRIRSHRPCGSPSLQYKGYRVLPRG